MTSSEDIYDVIIAGAGPAGSSAAIHLAQAGLSVLLVEQKGFPRAKLCGEFISPECQAHFQKLGVTDEMMSSDPALITETVFYACQGRHVTIPSSWFGGPAALGLSRAVMDENLLRRAQQIGVSVLENTPVTGLIEEDKRVRGVRIKTEVGEQEFRAAITIDATGRARFLTRKVQRKPAEHKTKPKLIAFKVHLEKTRVSPGACEIYVYPSGYGGLSTIEGDTSNLCFITAAEDVRRCHSNPETVLREIVMKNSRAAHALEGAKVLSEWLSVSLDDFGLQRPSPVSGLLSIGDSAAFIDPFTGSGMLMALQSGELVSQIIVRREDKSGKRSSSLETLEAEYRKAYLRKFHTRLRICGLLRHAAFQPRLAEITIAICDASHRLRSRLARATRSSDGENHGLANPS